jgi:hypothetical protein
MAQMNTAPESVARRTASASTGHLSSGLLLMAVMIGAGRALFGKKASTAERALTEAGDAAVSGHRGRMAG